MSNDIFGLKEANETIYWLSLLHDTDYIDEEAYKSIETDGRELIALLISSLNTISNQHADTEN